MKKKLIVIGGGASGFFCAVNAARVCKNLEVIIVEKTSKLLSKVKVSGGGRCNVTHYSEEVSDMTPAYPRGKNFMKKSLYRFSSNDTVSWFQERGVLLKTEHDGRMFPVTDDSQSIIDCLLQESTKYGVKILMQTRVDEIKPKLKGGFELSLNGPDKLVQNIDADFICIATGGSPMESGFDWLKNLGVEIEAPVPSLFTFNIADKKLHELMGVSVTDVAVKITNTGMQERGPLIITHWGLSGPSVLKMSSVAARDLHKLNYDFRVRLNWVPFFHESSILQDLKDNRIKLAKQSIGVKNPYNLPNRLWNYLLEKSKIFSDQSWSNVSSTSVNTLAKVICADEYVVQGKTTFKEEFVTAGGINLKEINFKTMESKIIPGVFICGEVLNIDGITGGFNFQNAWSTAWIASKNALNTNS
jgi:hypothetical protein